MTSTEKTAHREAELQRRFHRWGVLKETKTFWSNALYALSFVWCFRENEAAGVKK